MAVMGSQARTEKPLVALSILFFKHSGQQVEAASSSPGLNKTISTISGPGRLPMG